MCLIYVYKRALHDDNASSSQPVVNVAFKATHTHAQASTSTTVRMLLRSIELLEQHSSENRIAIYLLYVYTVVQCVTKFSFIQYKHTYYTDISQPVAFFRIQFLTTTTRVRISLTGLIQILLYTKRLTIN